MNGCFFFLHTNCFRRVCGVCGMGSLTYGLLFRISLFNILVRQHESIERHRAQWCRQSGHEQQASPRSSYVEKALSHGKRRAADIGREKTKQGGSTMRGRFNILYTLHLSFSVVKHKRISSNKQNDRHRSPYIRSLLSNTSRSTDAVVHDYTNRAVPRMLHSPPAPLLPFHTAPPPTPFRNLLRNMPVQITTNEHDDKCLHRYTMTHSGRPLGSLKHIVELGCTDAPAH